jgi:hypothetical protein
MLLRRDLKSDRSKLDLKDGDLVRIRFSVQKLIEVGVGIRGSGFDLSASR